MPYLFIIFKMLLCGTIKTFSFRVFEITDFITPNHQNQRFAPVSQLVSHMHDTNPLWRQHVPKARHDRDKARRRQSDASKSAICRQIDSVCEEPKWCFQYPVFSQDFFNCTNTMKPIWFKFVLSDSSISLVYYMYDLNHHRDIFVDEKAVTKWCGEILTCLDQELIRSWDLVLRLSKYQNMTLTIFFFLKYQIDHKKHKIDAKE